jgi:hypothetical protein
MRIVKMLCRPLLLLALTGSLCATAQENIELPSKGQTVYVPVYSAIHHGNLDSSGKADYDLMSVLVSVRNTDPKEGIRIVSAPYYDTNGKLIRDYLAKPRIIPPFGTFELFVERKEMQGDRVPVSSSAGKRRNLTKSSAHRSSKPCTRAFRLEKRCSSPWQGNFGALNRCHARLCAIMPPVCE